MDADPWRRLRIHRWVMFGGFLGWLPFGALVFAIQRVTGMPNRWVPYFIVPYMGAMVLNVALLAFFRCPRCGRLFVLRGAYGNVYTRRCLHCGQLAFAPIEPGPIVMDSFRLW